jgi:hypothetical protein
MCVIGLDQLKILFLLTCNPHRMYITSITQTQDGGMVAPLSMVMRAALWYPNKYIHQSLHHTTPYVRLFGCSYLMCITIMGHESQTRISGNDRDASLWHEYRHGDFLRWILSSPPPRRGVACYFQRARSDPHRRETLCHRTLRSCGAPVRIVWIETPRASGQCGEDILDATIVASGRHEGDRVRGGGDSREQA